MPLHINYIAETKIPVEVEGLTPDALRGQSLAEIEKFPIHHGNQQLPLAEMFRVGGTLDDGRIEFEGNLAGVHWIGAHLREGEIHIAGNAGRHLGSEMRGGTITVEGDTSDWVGGEMHGGTIHIHGSAGHLVGAAYRGSPRGMTGGTIIVHGNVGNEVGHSLRRGLIAVAGDCGDAPGFNMLAGTILLLGKCGIRLGASMRRGTIVLAGSEPPDLLPTFRHACRIRPLALRLLRQELRRQGLEWPGPENTPLVDLYNGDFLEGGRGEILIAAAA